MHACVNAPTRALHARCACVPYMRALLTRARKGVRARMRTRRSAAEDEAGARALRPPPGGRGAATGAGGWRRGRAPGARGRCRAPRPAGARAPRRGVREDGPKSSSSNLPPHLSR